MPRLEMLLTDLSELHILLRVYIQCYGTGECDSELLSKAEEQYRKRYKIILFCKRYVLSDYIFAFGLFRMYRAVEPHILLAQSSAPYKPARAQTQAAPSGINQSATVGIRNDLAEE